VWERKEPTENKGIGDSRKDLKLKLMELFMAKKHEITNEMKNIVAKGFLAGETNKAILTTLQNEAKFEYSVAKVSEIIRELKDAGTLPETKPVNPTKVAEKEAASKANKAKGEASKAGSKKTSKKSAPKMDVAEEVIEDDRDVEDVEPITYEELEKAEFDTDEQ
jgi:hypothetical protein